VSEIENMKETARNEAAVDESKFYEKKYKLKTGEADDKIAAWGKTGIPFDDFYTAFYSYPKWRVWRTSKVRKEARAKRTRKARPQETSQADKILLGVLGEMSQERKKAR
jgi:hypothetical protein